MKMASDDAYSVEITKSDTPPAEPPVDKMSLVYLGMIALGAGVLFPYNTVMAGSDYYDITWPDRNLKFYAPMAISIASPFMQLVMVHLQQWFSYSSRINVSFFVYSILIVVFPISVILLSNDAAFYVALIIFLAIGTVNAVLQSTLFAFGAMFPAVYTQALMAGNGWSGVTVSIARCITKYAFPANEEGYRNGTIVFFSLSAVITILCMVIYVFMRRSEFTSFYFTENVKSDSSSDATQALLSEAASATSLNTDPLPSPVEDAPVVDKTAVLHKVKFMGIHVMAVFIMTFLVFPGILFSIEPSIDLKDGWFGTLLVLEFNVFDMIGRSLPNVGLLFNASNVYIGVYARFLLYPFFLLFAHSSIFHSSWWVVIFNAIFAASSGYMSSLVMMYAPSIVDDHEKPTAGAYMSMFLVTGILLGSCGALLVEQFF